MARISNAANVIRGYTKARFTDLYYMSAQAVRTNKLMIVAFVVSLLFLVLLPYLHIGSYEKPGTTRYKNIYFNATRQTLAVWFITILFVLLTYDSIKYVARAIHESKLRWSMMFLFLVNIYPNYYDWWVYFNYHNDEFFSYYNHQTFFSITELISTAFVVHLCDARVETKSWKLWTIFSINLMHILASGADQFVENVILRHGKNFQITRDIGLMIPDILLILVTLRELVMYTRQDKQRFRSVCGPNQLILVLTINLGGIFLLQFL